MQDSIGSSAGPSTRQCDNCGEMREEYQFARHRIKAYERGKKKELWCNWCCRQASPAAVTKRRVKRYEAEIAKAESTVAQAEQAGGKAKERALTRVAELQGSRKFANLKKKQKRFQQEARARDKRRKQAEAQATPSWVDLDEIAAIYRKCEHITAETGVQHHVDHIVPLRGKGVCGLHVPWNLQIIPAVENLRKSNKVLP